MLSGCDACLKYFMFAFNFIVFLLGWGLIGLGIYFAVQTNGDNVVNVILSNEFANVAYVIIVIGVIAVLAGFFGCWGAIRESPCLLFTYAGVLIFLVIVEISIAIFIFAKKEDVQKEAEKRVTDNVFKSLLTYGKNATEEERESTKAWDLVQGDLKCCGANNYNNWMFKDGLIATDSNFPTDFSISKYLSEDLLKPETIEKMMKELNYSTSKFNSTKEFADSVVKKAKTVDKLPNSCCPEKATCTVAGGIFYKKPCLEAVKEFAEKYAIPLAITAIAIAVIEISGIIVSIYLACKIRKQDSQPPPPSKASSSQA